MSILGLQLSSRDCCCAVLRGSRPLCPTIRRTSLTRSHLLSFADRSSERCSTACSGSFAVKPTRPSSANVMSKSSGADLLSDLSTGRCTIDLFGGMLPRAGCHQLCSELDAISRPLWLNAPTLQEAGRVGAIRWPHFPALLKKRNMITMGFSSVSGFIPDDVSAAAERAIWRALKIEATILRHGPAQAAMMLSGSRVDSRLYPAVSACSGRAGWRRRTPHSLQCASRLTPMRSFPATGTLGRGRSLTSITRSKSTGADRFHALKVATMTF